ncbi:Ig-like domain-containing protein [Candidatus Peregrinibacteria bacterium]|nr:Ig-like domain-containing protein [Candidatus Peregrinibacteria bacterium]
MKNFLRLFLISLLAFIVSAQSVRAAFDFSRLAALDTVAGFETVVKLNGFSSKQNLAIKISRPDGSEIIKQTVADFNGNARATISGYETKLAGSYRVAVDGFSDATVFEVFPGEMSPAVSGLYASKTFAAANGVDAVKVNVRIVDEFGNPLEFHEVKLVSSRSSDRIFNETAETAGDGIASFLISSPEVGVSTFTATDESSSETISARLKIVFFRAKGVAKAVGGDPETILLAQSGMSAARFEIDNLAASLNVNETVSFRVKAVDASGAVVNSYAGTIIFSSTDPNAQLPSAYTFQPADQGQHTFDLGLSFRTAGSQKLTVQQQGNALIQGEKTVTVTTVSSGGSAGQVRITKPATGTYSLKILEIAGEATPNVKVKLFDNGQEMTEVQANSAGRFSFNTPLLQDGQHVFSASSSGVQSESVTVTIDSTPARVEQFDISKTDLAPGESVEISVRSDPDLNSIQATMGDFITDLEPDPQNPGIYRGTLTAPAQDGEYTINIIITDKVGNVSPAAEAGKIRVDAGLKPPPIPSFSVPSKVQGAEAHPGNAAVQITWQAAQAAAGIAQYRIYYGTDPARITLVTNTTDAKTSWIIPNLQNGTKYYFQVVGIDTNGNEGDNRSDVVNATPSPDAVLPGGGGGLQPPVLCDPMPCPVAPPPPYTPEDGPEVFGMVIAALVGSGALRFLKKRK